MIVRSQASTVSSISSNIRTSETSRSSSCILHLPQDSKYALSRNGGSNARFIRAPASRKAPDPLGLGHLLVSFPGCEFRPEQLERDTTFFAVHQSENQ